MELHIKPWWVCYMHLTCPPLHVASPRLCFISSSSLCGGNSWRGNQGKKKKTLSTAALLCNLSMTRNQLLCLCVTMNTSDVSGATGNRSQKWHFENSAAVQTHISSWKKKRKKDGTVFDYNSNIGGRLVTAERLNRQTARRSESCRTRSHLS